MILSFSRQRTQAPEESVRERIERIANGGSVAQLLEHVHPDDRARVLAKAHECAAASQDYFATTFRTVWAPTRFMRLAAVARRACPGISLHSGIVSDETTMVQAEAKLAMIADTTPALLWIMDAEGFCSFFSRSWYDFTGQTPEEALGVGWTNMVHPDDLAPAVECAKRAAREKGRFESIHRLRHRTLGWRWVMCVGNPRIDEAGNYLGHSGAVTDIHDRRLWEQHLRESENRYREFIADSIHPIWRVDFRRPLDTAWSIGRQVTELLHGSSLVECNHALASVHGVATPSELVGMPLVEALALDEPEPVAIDCVTSGYARTRFSVRPRLANGKCAAAGLHLTFSIQDGLVVRCWGTYTFLPQAAANVTTEAPASVMSAPR